MKIFSLAWKFAILALPWQTRWFLDAQLAGWPWEQGRLSFYVSWIPLIVAVVLGWRLIPRSQRRVSRTTMGLIAGLFVLSIIATRFDVSALRAGLQWWVQVGLLASFVFVLRRQAICWKKVATWTVIALIPHAILGIIQYANQEVWGASLLGIATQLPENAGVSVVEHGLFRVLRVYGGFPHPNIFGGWLVIGILTSLLLATWSEEKKFALFAMASSSLFLIALLLTYSRSAWLALLVGGIVLLGYVIRKKKLNHFFLLACGATILAGGIVGFSQKEHLLARGDTSSRLEAQSLSARAQSLQNGWMSFRAHPLIGSGPNADLLVHVPESGRTTSPLEPPHAFLLLALANFGILGMMLWGALMYRLKRSRSVGPIFPACIFLAPLFVVGLFDHYLWSYWSGQALIAFALLISQRGDD
ncbi:O-antigen ligase family protein [Patescibacteria group bacterium]|nr:O-antigen ligase family protein [Patescibacteria group bacterium]